ncbi:uncharacterized protein LOC62_07G008965 [Vanrija pseudolonga]|uniref:Uncharacterized protein n=1 Tax=Vanrija pseudolonga TaxID=143232 RepID=A0AAF1BL59_9TREE|nr:hypothetical protein LOC62_07G008965 [Vanrija pseudolonga]
MWALSLCLGRTKRGPTANGTPAQLPVSSQTRQPKNPSTTAPVVLDHAFLPHIMDAILLHAPPASLAVLRATSRTMQQLSGERLYAHIVARQQSDGSIDLSSPAGDRVPGLKYDADATTIDIACTLHRIHTYTRIVDVDMFPSFNAKATDSAPRAEWSIAAALRGVHLLRRLDSSPLAVSLYDLKATMTAQARLVPLVTEIEVAHLHLASLLPHASLLPDWCTTVALPGGVRTAVVVVHVPDDWLLDDESVPHVFANALQLVIVLCPSSPQKPINLHTTLRLIARLVMHYFYPGDGGVAAPNIAIGPLEAFDGTSFPPDVRDEDRATQLLGDLKATAEATLPDFDGDPRDIVSFVSLSELQKVHTKDHIARLPGLKYDGSASAREIDATLFRITTYTTMVDVDFTPPLGYNQTWDPRTIATLTEVLDEVTLIRRLDAHSLKGPQADIGSVWAQKIATVPSLNTTWEIVYLNLQAYADNEHTIPRNWCSAVIVTATVNVAMLVLDIPEGGSTIERLTACSVPFVFANAANLVLVVSNPASNYPFLDVSSLILRFLDVLVSHFIQASVCNSAEDCPNIFIGPIEAFDDTFFSDGVSDKDKGDELLENPATVPLPSVSLDHTFLPHIFDRIFAFAPPSALIYLRAAPRAMAARCDAALYRHMRINLRPTAPTASTAASYAVEFRTPDAARLRVPGMNWTAGESMCLHVLRTATRVLDIELFHDDGLNDWVRFLRSAEDLRRVLGSVEILRRVYGTLAVPVPVEAPNAVFGRGTGWR